MYTKIHVYFYSHLVDMPNDCDYYVKERMWEDGIATHPE